MRGIDVHAEQMALVPFLGTGADFHPDQANQIILDKSTEARALGSSQSLGELRTVELQFIFVG